MSVIMKLVTVTPELAYKFLELNTQNRAIREAVVERYADDMKQGRWKLNGESIKVTPTRLLDGQHRLWAVIKADVPVQIMVVDGLDEGTFDTIDTGLKRTGGDVLTFAGATDKFNAAGAITALHHYLRGNWKCIGSVTNSQVLELYRKYPDDISEAVRSTTRKGLRKLLPCSYAAPLYFLFCTIDKDKAVHFFDRLGSGEDLSSDSPIMVLRNKLIGRRKLQSGRLDRYCVVGMVIKAWNAYMTNRVVKQLCMSTDDQMPSIHGRKDLFSDQTEGS